jgi:hypothetical protein
MADEVAVRYPEGTAHGLLVVKSLNGKQIGKGDLTETVEGKRVTSQLTLNFKNGSSYEETAQFTQDGSFHLLDYHLIQAGPSFDKALDLRLDVARGVITVRCSHAQSGDCKRRRTWTKRMDVPPDIANGIIPFLVRNIPPGADKVTVPMIVATPKPRLVHLTISPTALQSFPFEGSRIQATRYAITVDLGGVTGPIAKLTGREPPPSFVWMLHSKVPSFLMSQEAFEGGPVCRIELASPTLPAHDANKSGS